MEIDTFYVNLLVVKLGVRVRVELGVGEGVRFGLEG